MTSIDSIQTGNGAVDALAVAFSERGLALPPAPPALRSRLAQIAPTIFSTRTPVGGRRFDIEAQLDSLVQDAAQRLLVAVAGHGVNSNVLHYWLVHGRLAVFLVRRWGNVYDDAELAARRIEGAFEVIAEMIACCDRLEARNALPAGKTLVVVDTEEGRQRCGWSDLSPASLAALGAPGDAPALFSALMDLREREASNN